MSNLGCSIAASCAGMYNHTAAGLIDNDFAIGAYGKTAEEFQAKRDQVHTHLIENMGLVDLANFTIHGDMMREFHTLPDENQAPPAPAARYDQTMHYLLTDHVGGGCSKRE